MATLALGPDTTIDCLIMTSDMPLGIYLFANPPALYEALLNSVAPQAPQEDPLPSIYLPL